MKKIKGPAIVGIVGLGDMGSGLAKNLIKNKFNTIGLDLSKKRMEDFKRMGGVVAQSLSDVGKFADIVFVMVMNGNQAKEVIINKDGLIHGLKKNSTVIITATIKLLKSILDLWNSSTVIPASLERWLIFFENNTALPPSNS